MSADARLSSRQGYSLRIEADPDEPDGAPSFETRSEDVLRMTTSTAPGSAFFVGQLVHVRGADGNFRQLARVCDVRTADAAGASRLAYWCRHVPDGWGFGV